MSRFNYKCNTDEHEIKNTEENLGDVEVKITAAGENMG